MISFSYRSFREHLNSNLEREEARFLVRTFGIASGLFFGFGILLSAVYYCLSSIGFGKIGFSVPCFLVGVVSCMALSFMAMKYRNNPLRMPATFVSAIYSLLTFTFLASFLGLMGILSEIVPREHKLAFVYGSIAVVFGISFLIYLIPCMAALMISSRGTIITVNKFLNGCYILFFGLWLLSLLVGFVGFRISGGFTIALFLLTTIILLLSPVITIYRMKTVAYYINHEDSLERKKWESYFVFEILFQLLQLALHVMRILVMVILGGRGWRTRL